MDANRPAGALALLAVLTACGGGSGTPSVSPTVGAFQSPSPQTSEGPIEPPESAAADPTASAVGAIVRVVADALQIRAEPGTGADAIGALARDALARVESGPVEADGFSWYQVVDLSGAGGWVADGDGIDSWLAPAAENGDETVLLSFSYGCDVTGPLTYPATTITEDARVILGYGREGGMTVGQLSATGMAHIRENVLEHPYLQTSGEYSPVPRPGAGDPPGHGACLYTFTLPTDAEPIVVHAVSWFGDREEAEFWQPSPQRRALTEIANNLMVIDEVLGDENWDGRPAVPYAATEYVLWVGAGEGVEPAGIGTIDPDDLGLGALDGYGDPNGGGRCAVVPIEDAFEVLRVLNQRAGDDAGLSDLAFLSFGTAQGWYSLVMIPRTPDGQPGCGAIGL